VARRAGDEGGELWSGDRRRWLGVGGPSFVAASALVLGACGGGQTERYASGGGGGAGTGGAGGESGSGAITITVPDVPTPCAVPQAGAAVFANTIVSNTVVPSELYTWTTEEQIAEIRAGNVLLTRTEREGLGRGYAFDVLATFEASTDPNVAALATYLSGDAFALVRYGWAHPWATRLGWPGETYGNQLVRIKLRSDAWIARLQTWGLDVVDLSGNAVPLDEALASPERIAAIYFIKLGDQNGSYCGSFQSGGNGYREVIVGNEAMIEEWSIATSDMRARLEQDIADLSQFFQRIRSCPETNDPTTWNHNVACNWGIVQTDEMGAYDGSLAMPSVNYLPTPEAIAALIATLNGDLFEPDPLVVRPGG
jgi:hypothetical protein